MGTLSIPVVLGTAREGRASERVARAVVELMEQREHIKTQLVDVRESTYRATVPPWGEGGANEYPTRWKEIAEQAHGFVLVVPEYNRGYPGELKLFLDSLHDSYDKKPVLVCGVSAGVFGGRAVVEHMRPVLLELKMVPIRGGVYVGNAKEFSADEMFEKRFSGKLDELVWFAAALKSARESNET